VPRKKRLAGFMAALVGAGALLAFVPAVALATAPEVLAESVSNVTATDATINAVIEDKAAPHGALYQFQLVANPSEYQPEFDCPPEWERSSLCLKMPERGEHSGTLPVGVTKAGLPEQLVSQDVAKAKDVGSLQPNTTYHYRVIAASDIFEEDFYNWEPPIVYGPDQTFTTLPAAVPPRWFINYAKAGTKHEPGFAFGAITLENKTLKNLTCQNFSANFAWNEVKEGTERGFGETTGYSTWECKSEAVCEVTNENGVKKEGVFATAEGPPSLTPTEKARHTGNTSLPWTEELTEKEGNRKEFFVLTHHVKVWIDIPVAKSLGGPGEGPGCALLGGKEIAFEEQEGPTEKAACAELAPKTVNGAGNGLGPSHAVFAGEKGKTEKGPPETGCLTSKEFGEAFTTGSLVTAGSTDFELVTAEE
jgi:hypothetical protein